MQIPAPFPDDVAFASVAFDAADEAALAPSERASLSPRAVKKRRLEFTAGRLAARKALELAGFDPAPPVVPGPDRAPVWPTGWVGTISHTHGIALAAVAPKSHYRGLGLDLEYLHNLKRIDVARQICDEAERAWVGEDRRRLLQLFSAKESVFKAIYPSYRQFFGFAAVTSRWDAAQDLFHMTTTQPLGAGYPQGTILRVSVRWHGDFVVTWLSLPG